MKALPAFGLAGRHRVLRAPGKRPPAWTLTLLLTAGVGAALPLMGWGPQAQEQRQALRQAGDSLRAQRDAARARLELSQHHLARLQSELSTLTEAVPTRPDALLAHRLALQHAVRVERLRSAPRQSGATPPVLSAVSQTASSWSLEVRGSYRSLLTYLQALEQTGPAWSLKQLQLSAGRPHAHRLSLVLEPLAPAQWIGPQAPRAAARSSLPDPFGLAPEAISARLDAPAPVPQSTVRNEAQPVDPLADLPLVWRPEFERPRGPLESLPLKEFFLAGTIKQGRAWFALVRAGSVVHALAVGDYLGPDLGRVQWIDEAGLGLREIRRDPGGRWAEQLRRWPVGGAP